MVGTVSAPISCLEVGAEAAVHPRPVSREGWASELPAEVVATIIQEESGESWVVAEAVVLEPAEETAASEREAVVP